VTTWSRRIAAVALATTLAAGLAACGDDDDSGSATDAGTEAALSGGGAAVTLADKGFTESAVVAQAYAQALDARGFDASVTSLASTEIADKAVRDGEIDAYPEYDGTTWLNVLGKTADDAPADRDAFFEAVVDASAPRGLTALPPAPYNNGNEVACTQEAVDQNSITDLSALGTASPNLVYSANAEHLTRPDGLPLLRSEYGVNFKNTITVDISLRYTPIEDGKAQCVYAFGTDPQLAKLPLVLVKDDKGAFSGKIPFRSYPVVNTAWLEGLSPDARTAFEQTLAQVNAGLTQERIQELNAAVDIDKEDPETVAGEFVGELGITAN
jgi:osmoprotectant transport system substrate-binding protein